MLENKLPFYIKIPLSIWGKTGKEVKKATGKVLAFKGLLTMEKEGRLILKHTDRTAIDVNISVFPTKDAVPLITISYLPSESNSTIPKLMRPPHFAPGKKNKTRQILLMYKSTIVFFFTAT